MAEATAIAPLRDEARRAGAVKSLVAAIAASFVEGYDTTVFGIYAVILGRMFFPNHDGATALLSAFGAFAAGYLMRPIGSLVLGAYADRLGRRNSVALIVVVMSVSTGVIGMLPTYARIGVAAPVLVVLARLVQGFAAGGSNSTAAVYIAELVPTSSRGLVVSLKYAVQVASFLFSSLLGALIFSFSDTAVTGWGWRLPFLLALLIGPLGIYIRFRGAETLAFVAEPDHAAVRPIREAFLRFKYRMLLSSAVGCLHTTTAFILLLFMPAYAVRQLHIPLKAALMAGTASSVVAIAACILGGWISDRIGYKKVLVISAGATLVGVYPSFLFLVGHPTGLSLLAVESLLGVLTGPFAGVNLALKVEFFPTETRGTALSLSDGVNTLLFGGAGAILVTWMMTALHSGLAPAHYVAACAALSLISVLSVRPAMLFPFTDEGT
jgi:MHS family proline/betaine transporter-like MFS transporter